jgi:FdhD protein
VRRSAIPPPAIAVARTAIRGDVLTDGPRTVPAETPVALTYNRATHAVMLASPADLEDFAVGFSLAEGIIAHPADLLELEIVAVPDGIEARMMLDPARLDALSRRQRRLAGPSGCGLCGLDSLRDAIRPVPRVTAAARASAADIDAAMAALGPAQALNHLTRGVHAAAFWTPARGLLAVREDVGRHNALDKLAGGLARQGISAQGGLLLLTSRVSVELVQKAATMGAPILVAVSVPTDLAIRTADAAGITLVAVARADGFEVFTHPARILHRPVQHVA